MLHKFTTRPERMVICSLRSDVHKVEGHKGIDQEVHHTKRYIATDRIMPVGTDWRKHEFTSLRILLAVSNSNVHVVHSHH